MNHREPTHLSAGARRALHCLSLLLLPALAPGGGDPGLRDRRPPPGGRPPEPKPTPYLVVIGAPALRFAEAVPPPDLTTRPGAAAPPHPASTPAEEAVATENIAAAQSIAEAAREAAATPVTEALAPVKETPPPVKTPPAILPDDARPPVRAEDFLPFFQVPGSARRPEDIMLIAPVPMAPAAAPLPPSSATYIQSK